MYRRIQQLQDEIVGISERVNFSGSDTEMLVASVRGIEDFRRPASHLRTGSSGYHPRSPRSNQKRTVCQQIDLL
jgi:hypothetical protein